MYVITRKDGQQFAFSLYGRLEAIIDRLGNQVTVSSSTGQIQRIATPNGRYLDFSYDSANRISRILDMAGREWIYAYEDGMLSSVTLTDQSTERYSYGAAGPKYRRSIDEVSTAAAARRRAVQRPALTVRRRHVFQTRKQRRPSYRTATR